MKAMLDSATEHLRPLIAWLERHPVLYRALGLVLTLALYLGGLWLLELVSVGTHVPLVLGGLYFLPAVLRAWVLLWWALRDEGRLVKRRWERHA